MKKVLGLIGFVFGTMVFMGGGSCGGTPGDDPNLPPEVTIEGPSPLVFGPNKAITLSAKIKNGRRPFTYEWQKLSDPGLAKLTEKGATPETSETADIQAIPQTALVCVREIEVALRVTDSNPGQPRTVDAKTKVWLRHPICSQGERTVGSSVTSLSSRDGDLWVGTPTKLVQFLTNVGANATVKQVVDHTNSKLGGGTDTYEYVNAVFLPEGSSDVWAASCRMRGQGCYGVQRFDAGASNLNDFGAWTRYSNSNPTTSPANYNVLPQEQTVRVMALFDKKMLFGTYIGLVAVNSNHERVGNVINSGQYVSSLAQDRSGNVWVGTDRTFILGSNAEGIWVYPKGDFTKGIRFSGKEWDPAVGSTNVNVGALAEDLDGNMWIGLNWDKGGVVRFKPDASGDWTKGWSSPKWFADETTTVVTAMVCDREGNIWVGTSNGLGMIPRGFDPESTDSKAPQLEKLDKTSFGHVTSLAYDSSQNALWVGQKNKTDGLLRYQLGL